MQKKFIILIIVSLFSFHLDALLEELNSEKFNMINHRLAMCFHQYSSTDFPSNIRQTIPFGSLVTIVDTKKGVKYYILRSNNDIAEFKEKISDKENSPIYWYSFKKYYL